MSGFIRASLLGAAIVAAAGCGGAVDDRTVAQAQQPLVLDAWVPRGGELVTAPGTWYAAGPALADAGRLVAWSEESSTFVRRWSQETHQWLDLAGGTTDVLPGNIPAVAQSDDGTVFVCRVVNRFLEVARWTGTEWVTVGGAPLDILTLNADTWFRYEAQGCSMTLNSKGRPVVAWSTRNGVKHHIAYVAKWNGSSWHILGDALGDDRATYAQVVLDANDRPYVVTHKAGGSYGGGNTTRVFRWINNAWEEIGEGRASTWNPSIDVQGGWLYLGLLAEDEGSRDTHVRVYRARTAAATPVWTELPGTVGGLTDASPQLKLDQQGCPFIALEREGTVVVEQHLAGQWQPVGLPIPLNEGAYVQDMDLSFTWGGAARVAIFQQVWGDVPVASIRVWRE